MLVFTINLLDWLHTRSRAVTNWTHSRLAILYGALAQREGIMQMQPATVDELFKPIPDIDHQGLIDEGYISPKPSQQPPLTRTLQQVWDGQYKTSKACEDTDRYGE